jgi:hypothetical protein
MKKLLLILLLFAGTTYAQSSVSVNLGAVYANGSLIAELLPAAGGPVAITHIFLDANGATTIQTLIPGKTYGFWATDTNGASIVYGRVTVTGAAQDITASLLGVGGANGTCNIGLSGPGGMFIVTGTPAGCNQVLHLMTVGNSGGIPCFTNSTTLNSSVALNNNALLAGGGPGACPGPSSVTDDKVNPTRVPNGLNMAASYLVIESQNTAPGTVLASLACNSGTNVTLCPANPAAGSIVGISEQGSGSSSGIVALCILGPCPVVFDNQSVIGDIAIPSVTVAGALHDTGGPGQVTGYNFRVSGANTGPGTVGSTRPPGDIAGGNSTVSCLTTAGDIWSATTGGTCQRLAAPTSPNNVPQYLVSTPTGGVGNPFAPTLPGIIPRYVTSTFDTILATDRAQFVQYTNASPQSVVLPQPGSTGFTNNFETCVQNRSTTGVPTTGVITFTSTSSTINGQSTYQLTQNNSACFLSDNTNWITKDVNASGSILSTANNFTNTNTFGANVAFKGPNPYYDLSQFGLYVGSGGGITCSITSGTNTASCGGGIGDFTVGKGIEIPLAGVTPAFPTWGVSTISAFSRNNNIATYTLTGGVNVPVPGTGQIVTIAGMSDASFNGSFTVTGNDGDFGHFFTANTGSNVGSTASSGTATLTSPQVTVTPQGVSGSTTYNYKIVMRGYHGELSVASAAGTSTTSAATLGPNAPTVSSCSRSAGLATCTTSAAHNFIYGIGTTSVDLEGTSNDAYNGVHIIASTPTTTTFTFYQTDLGNDSGTTTGGTAKVVARNLVQWDMVPYSVLQSIVYRSVGAGAYSIVGIVEGMDGAFVDWGLAAPAVPGYFPATPPSSPTNGILATTITSISGTNLTLAANASNTATSQFAQHDNTPIVLAGCTAIGGAGGDLVIPAQSTATQVPFNSPLDLYNNCAANQLTIEVGTPLLLNEPVIAKPSGFVMKARPGAARPGSSFQTAFSTNITGTAYPFFYYVPGSFGPNTLENFVMNCNQPYQSCVVQDQDSGGGGVATINYTNDIFSGTAGSMPFIMRSGGFNFWFDRGAFAVVGGAWGVPASLQIVTPNPLGGTPTSNKFTLPGIIRFDKTIFAGEGIEYNNWGLDISAITGHATFFETTMENAYSPFMSVYLPGSSSLLAVDFDFLTYADYRSGGATPIMAFSPGVRTNGITVKYASCASANQPLFEGLLVSGVEVTQSATQGCGLIGAQNVVRHDLQGKANATTTYAGSLTNYQNALFEVSGAGKVFFPMDVPAAPASAVVSAGGSITVGVNCYAIFAYDKDGGTTTNGPTTCATTTTGNQTVTITRPATLPGNATGWNAAWYPPGSPAYNFLSCAAVPFATTTIVQTFSAGCGNAFNFVTTAGKANIGSSGLSAQNVSTNQLTIIGTTFANLGTPADGTFYFCPDCTVANPCAGSGTGALAKRLGGVWVCN